MDTLLQEIEGWTTTARNSSVLGILDLARTPGKTKREGTHNNILPPQSVKTSLNTSNSISKGSLEEVVTGSTILRRGSLHLRDARALRILEEGSATERIVPMNKSMLMLMERGRYSILNSSCRKISLLRRYILNTWNE